MFARYILVIRRSILKPNKSMKLHGIDGILYYDYDELLYGNFMKNLSTQTRTYRVSIREIHLGCQERHNLNMSIVSPEDLFAQIILFWISLWRRQKMGIGLLNCSVT